MSDDERVTTDEHVQIPVRARPTGGGIGFGPVDNAGALYGIEIVLAEDIAAARALRDGGPGLASLHGFQTEFAPMLQLERQAARNDRPCYGRSRNTATPSPVRLSRADLRPVIPMTRAVIGPDTSGPVP
jgi:hypothetical protein